MRKSQEANDSVSIEQEQADQVRRTTGATLAARALEEVLPAIAKGYGPNMHRKTAEHMSKDMDKPGFTPGPWITRCDEDEDTGRPPLVFQADEAAPLYQGDPDPRFVAAVGCESPTEGWTDEDRANARLIAAAPDLFKACEQAAEYLADPDPSAFRSTVRNALRAALAAARGERDHNAD